MDGRRIFSGAPWEQIVGYCRAVRMGNFVAVSGTTSVDSSGQVVAPGDAYQQTRRCLEIIEAALNEFGAHRKNILRTRIFVVDLNSWPEIGRAHKEFCGEHPPATSMIEIKGLINPDLLVEIEADAWLS